MVTAQSLKSLFDDKAAQIESAVSGVSEEQARKSPADGEWCVREVLYHLSGDVDQTFIEGIQRFIDEDKPELPLTPGDVYTSPEREKATLQELAAAVAAQYRALGDYVAGLSNADLARIGRIGFLQQVRGSDEITLAEWATVIGNYHLNVHIEQIRNLAK
jgi:hypothetical protein